MHTWIGPKIVKKTDSRGLFKASTTSPAIPNAVYSNALSRVIAM